MRALLKAALVAAAAVLSGPASAQDKAVRIWIRGFIPNSHPSIPNFTKKTDKGTWVIDAPNIVMPGFDIGRLRGTCFSTDDRGFDENPLASARVTVDLTLKFSGRREFTISASERQDSIIRIGLTRNVDCKTGADLQTAERADPSGVTVGTVRKNGFLRIFNVAASVADPFYRILGVHIAPRLDFDIIFEYDSLQTDLKLKGVFGIFPSFEGYYSIGGVTKQLFRLPPTEGAGAYTLADFGTGINTRNYTTSIDLTDLLVR